MPLLLRRVRNELQGFTLIEVLIALVIMSVGMLGIAGLYVHSMQAGRTSLLRHNAVTLAGDVADRIRANPKAAAAYVGAGANNNCVAAGINCSAAQMASHDIWLWDQQAADSLPNGAVAIVLNNAVVPPTYQITVNWTEPGETPSYSVTIPVSDK
ncbi:MAG: type IV pilus modification protein PilV [Gammaproteobacteria bacterium]|nr:MAG: type IV pilus modification protein PilV [Gammaproteobacteria bacterium]